MALEVELHNHTVWRERSREAGRAPSCGMRQAATRDPRFPYARIERHRRGGGQRQFVRVSACVTVALGHWPDRRAATRSVPGDKGKPHALTQQARAHISSSPLARPLLLLLLHVWPFLSCVRLARTARDAPRSELKPLIARRGAERLLNMAAERVAKHKHTNTSLAWWEALCCWTVGNKGFLAVGVVVATSSDASHACCKTCIAHPNGDPMRQRTITRRVCTIRRGSRNESP